MLRYTDANTELDNGSTDDLNYDQDTNTLLVSTKLNHAVNGLWDYSLKLSHLDNSLEGNDPDTSSNRSDVDTEINTMDWQNNLYLDDKVGMLTFGFEYEEQKGENGSANIDKSIDNNAFYLQDQLFLLDDNLKVSAGIRNDDHSKFGSETTYSFSTLYKLQTTGTKLKANWGKAFKAPTINDLFYDASWGKGNPNLQPEENRGYDIGIEQQILGERLQLSAVYFQNKFKNLIAWDWSVFPMIPANLAEAETSGWELGLKGTPFKNILFEATYTIADSEDMSNGNELARRPKHKGSVSLGWHQNKISANLTVNYVGNRWDNSSNTNRLDAYKKGDLAISYDLINNLKVFGRVENISNREYEEAKGYGTTGRSYYAGMKASF